MYMGEQDVASLYKVDGECGIFTMSRFNSMYAGGFPNPNETSDNSIDVEDQRLASRILQRGGAAFKEIYITDLYRRKYAANMPEILFLKCPNLEWCHFSHENTLPWIRVFSERTKSLELSLIPPRETPLAMLLHCYNLRQLTLEGTKLTNPEGSILWENIGGTLEILKLGMCYSGEEDMRKIQKYNRKLTKIDIRGYELNTRALSECLAAYEGQLEFVTIREMERDELQPVVDKCTNSLCHLMLDHSDVLYYLIIIGKQLVSFSNDFYAYGGEGRDLTAG